MNGAGTRTDAAPAPACRSVPARIGAFLRLLPSPRTTPFTFYYLIVLALTTLLLHYGRPTAVHRLLRLSSTDAVNLQHHPIQALLLSALWLQDAHWLVYAIIFTAVIAPLERRVGTRWTVLIFASGHVLASLATELPVLVAVRTHLLPIVDARLIDVGVSYGFFAVAGALLILLPTPARWWVLGLLNASIVAIYLGMDPTSTDAVVTVAGHVLSLYIGMLGWLPWLRRRGLVASLRLPWRTAPWRKGFVTPSAAPAGTSGI
ncbi:MAG TPA: rhomboid-like protein [Pseudonocardiaceae bacterium]